MVNMVNMSTYQIKSEVKQVASFPNPAVNGGDVEIFFFPWERIMEPA